MARYDKYDPISGGFRAALAADFPDASLHDVLAVGLDANGRVVVGGGNTGVVGVMVLNSRRYAGDVVDVMTDGEIVEVDGLAAGTVHFGVAASGAVAGAGDTRIGHTAEASRLIVRAAR